MIKGMVYQKNNFSQHSIQSTLSCKKRKKNLSQTLSFEYKKKKPTKREGLY